MIFPTSYRLFKVIDNRRSKAKIYLYNQTTRIYKGEIIDISPEQFDKLRIFLEELIRINNSQQSLTFGIVEIQNLIEGFK